MTFTVTLFILAFGIVIGWRLSGPLAKARAYHRRRTFKPRVLRPFDAADLDKS